MATPGAVPGGAPALHARVAQERLLAHGFLADDAVTGRFDRATLNAVARFQAAHALPVDGQLDARTADALLCDRAHATGAVSGLKEVRRAADREPEPAPQRLGQHPLPSPAEDIYCGAGSLLPSSTRGLQPGTLGTGWTWTTTLRWSKQSLRRLRQSTAPWLSPTQPACCSTPTTTAKLSNSSRLRSS
ncbi:peptidoglycan-binding protein [Solirubrobacter sp. CPCC 204708]|nr:peptidoglycan-binding protein [Solirubrobacter deserti]